MIITRKGLKRNTGTTVWYANRQGKLKRNARGSFYFRPNEGKGCLKLRTGDEIDIMTAYPGGAEFFRKPYDIELDDDLKTITSGRLKKYVDKVNCIIHNSLDSEIAIGVLKFDSKESLFYVTYDRTGKKYRVYNTGTISVSDGNFLKHLRVDYGF